MNVFVESLKRLYKDGKVSDEKVLELFQSGKITENEKWDIFNVRKGL